jgi:hypothetical protein
VNPVLLECLLASELGGVNNLASTSFFQHNPVLANFSLNFQQKGVHCIPFLGNFPALSRFLGNADKINYPKIIRFSHQLWGTYKRQTIIKKM